MLLVSSFTTKRNKKYNSLNLPNSEETSGFIQSNYCAEESIMIEMFPRFPGTFIISDTNPPSHHFNLMSKSSKYLDIWGF